MNKKQLHVKVGLTGFALASFLCLSQPTWAQAPTPQQDNRPAQDRDQDRDANRQELINFDHFLDSHREISEQVRKDPSLVDKPDFVRNHPALQTYLHDHPRVREVLKDDPNAFMRAEERVDRRDDDRGRPENDRRRQETANFNRFLDDHRDVATELRRDPSRIDDREFVRNHPELETYLRDHPEVRDDFKSNPNSFMRTEDRMDVRDDQRNRQELANFDRFLDGHQEIAEQIRRNPSLVDNDQFVRNHPPLQSYLQDHPEVRREIKADPNAFMVAENRYERTEDRRPGQGSSLDRDDMHRRFGEFLNGHADINARLSENPSLAKDHDFIHEHPEFERYLNANPDVQKELTDHPDTFVKSSQQFNTNNSITKPTGAKPPESKPTEPKPTEPMPTEQPKPKPNQ